MWDTIKARVERLKMSRKVLKKIGVAHCHIFFSMSLPPIQAKIVEAAPFFSPLHPPPIPLLMTGPQFIIGKPNGITLTRTARFVKIDQYIYWWQIPTALYKQVLWDSVIV